MFGPTVGIEGKMPSLLGSATGEAGEACVTGDTSTGRASMTGSASVGVLFRIFSDRCEYPHIAGHLGITFIYPMAVASVLEITGNYHAFYMPDPLLYGSDRNIIVRDHEPRVICLSEFMDFELRKDPVKNPERLRSRYCPYSDGVFHKLQRYLDQAKGAWLNR